MTERGTASIELALGAALLLVPAVVAVLSFAPWLEARAFVQAAAAEAARSAVLSAGDPVQAGVEVVGDLAASRGVEEVSVEMCGGTVCVLERGRHVSASVSVVIPLLSTPWGEVGGITVAAAHSEPVDLYRSLP